MVCFNQEERVAGLMSEMCPFLEEMKSRDRDPLRSFVRFNNTSGRPQDTGPVFLELSIIAH